MPSHTSCWDRVWVEQGSRAPPEKVVLAFIELLRKRRFWKVVDIGCGTGRNLLPLVSQGFHVTGIDISRVAIDRTRSAAQTKGLPEPRLIQCDVSKGVPFEDIEFDAAVAMNSIDKMRLPDIRRCVGELKRILKPKGLALISVDSTKHEAWTNKIGKVVGRNTILFTHSGCLAHFFTKVKLLRLLNDFKILRVRERHSKLGTVSAVYWDVFAQKL